MNTPVTALIFFRYIGQARTDVRCAARWRNDAPPFNGLRPGGVHAWAKPYCGDVGGFLAPPDVLVVPERPNVDWQVSLGVVRFGERCRRMRILWRQTSEMPCANSIVKKHNT